MEAHSSGSPWRAGDKVFPSRAKRLRRLSRPHPGCIPGDPPICRKCRSEARLVDDGQDGPSRYDCLRCDVRFDPYHSSTSLETYGLSRGF